MNEQYQLERDTQTALALFGISEGTSLEDVEARYRELSRYFETSSFPAALRDWAKQQAALVDQAYAVLLAGHELASKWDQTASAPSAETSAGPKRAEQVRGDADKSVRAFRLRPTLVAGLMLAAIAGAVVMARMGVPGKEAAAADATQQASDVVPIDPRRAAELMKAVQNDPQNKDALFELGEMNFLAGQWQLAVDWFTKELVVDPANVHARTDVGTAAFNLGRTEEAKKSWLAGLEIAPGDVQLNFNIGFLYANAEPQDLAAARKAWQKVIDADPASSLAKTAQAHMASLVAGDTGSAR